jgi:putative sigma-54 modulation protein
MKIEFTGRNFSVSPSIRKHVTHHLGKLDTMLNGATRAHVILSVGKHHRHLAEIVVNWQDHALTSKSDTTDMYLSASQAVDRLRRQALKVKGKIITGKHRSPATSVVAPSPTPPVEPERDGPRIIHSRRYSVKPMTAEEAMIRVIDAAGNFLVFRNADTDRIGIIYKRKDGNYGLIEP